MSRWVTPASSGVHAVSRARTDVEPTDLVRTGAPGEGEADGPLNRIAKYVPTEILACYTCLFTVLVSMQLIASEQIWASFALIGLFFIVTIIYIWKNAGAGSVRTCHMIVSPLAFLAWAYPISSALLGDYYYPLAAFFGQAVIIAMSLFFKPVD